MDDAWNGNPYINFFKFQKLKVKKIQNNQSEICYFLHLTCKDVYSVKLQNDECL